MSGPLGVQKDTLVRINQATTNWRASPDDDELDVDVVLPELSNGPIVLTTDISF